MGYLDPWSKDEWVGRGPDHIDTWPSPDGAGHNAIIARERAERDEHRQRVSDWRVTAACVLRYAGRISLLDLATDPAADPVYRRGAEEMLRAHPDVDDIQLDRDRVMTLVIGGAS